MKIRFQSCRFSFGVSFSKANNQAECRDLLPLQMSVPTIWLTWLEFLWLLTIREECDLRRKKTVFNNILTVCQSSSCLKIAYKFKSIKKYKSLTDIACLLTKRLIKILLLILKIPPLQAKHPSAEVFFFISLIVENLLVYEE